MVVYTCNPTTQEGEAGGSRRAQGQSELHSEFEVGLEYIKRPCLKDGGRGGGEKEKEEEEEEQEEKMAHSQEEM